ncbi:MAG: hypothetical protein ACKOWF_14310 [Chloroflexota bacterium]
MDSKQFDRIARMLGLALTRRQGAGAAIAAALGLGAAAEAKAEAGGHRHHRGNGGRGRDHRRDGDSDPETAGPCGDGKIGDNRCTKHSQCCTRRCNRKIGRCRCLPRGKKCKGDRNCCNDLQCVNRKCTPKAAPKRPVPTGQPCGPTDTCADAKASCTVYASGDPAGTYCLIPYLGACAASGDCETQDCDAGTCISCSCEGCGGACEPMVCPTCTYQTVQAAIDAAASGDIITIAPGTYAEDFTIAQTVTLKGCPGGEVILTSATVPRRTILLSEGYDLTLIDVIVDTADYQGTPSDNGGIDAMGNLTLCRNAAVRNAFSNSCCDGGGCIHMGRVAPAGITLTMNDQSVVENCTSNRSGHYGGGVYLDSYAHMVMNDTSVVRGNKALGGSESGGGGVGVYTGADLVMNDMARITGNRSNRAGGGVKVYSGGGIPFVLQMNDEASIDNNTSVLGGGGVFVIYGNSDDLDLVHMSGSATIANNNSDSYGGGISLDGGAFSMADSASITGNRASYYGGGIYSASSAAWTVAHSVVMSGEATVSGNTTDTYGGGIYASYSLILVEDSATIAGNTTVKDGGGVYLESRFSRPSSLELSGSAAITENTAAQGGGVFAVDNSQTVIGAAAITGNTPDQCVGATGC